MICLSCETLWEKLGRNLRALWTGIQAFWHDYQIAEQERKAQREKMEAESFRESEPLYSSDLISSRRYPASEIIIKLSQAFGTVFYALFWLSLIVVGISLVYIGAAIGDKDYGKAFQAGVVFGSSLYLVVILGLAALAAYWFGETIKIHMDIEESTRQTRENTEKIVELLDKGDEEATKEA